MTGSPKSLRLSPAVKVGDPVARLKVVEGLRVISFAGVYGSTTLGFRVRGLGGLFGVTFKGPSAEDWIIKRRGDTWAGTRAPKP